MLQTLAEHGWDAELDDTLFRPAHWHQSLSDSVDADDRLRDAMLALGDGIDMAAFTLEFNRVRGARAPNGRIHWTFHAKGHPKPFAALVEAICNGMQTLGVQNLQARSPHVTVSYHAPRTLRSTPVVPIAWRLDELLLVEKRGAGDGFHYAPLRAWRLRRAPPGPESQRTLW